MAVDEGGHSGGESGGDTFAWAGRIAVICLGSLVVMIEAARECDKPSSSPFYDPYTSHSCTKYRGWAVACSTISLGISLGLLLGWKFNMLSAPSFPVPHGDLVTSLFFFCLWGAGAGSLTTKAPFQYAGNGYFGTWLCFFISAGLAIKSTPQFQATMNALAAAGNDIMMIFFASFVLMLQASIDCDASNTSCDGKQAYAVAVGVVSLVFSLVGIFFRQMVPPVPFAVCMCAWWSVAWFVITVFGPYQAASGNGYFSTVAAFFFSIKIVFVMFDLVKYIERADLYRGGSNDTSSAPPRTEASTLVAPSAPAHESPYESIGGGGGGGGQTEC